MSNHYHVVLRIDTDSQQALTDNDVVNRWRQLHRVPENFELYDDERRQTLVAVWRDRLGSISWFMKSLNEPLARLANKEDGCSGRFWEGRFRSQALLDEDAVLKCMAYVDLNPIRAKMADTPESSMYTSVKARIDGQPRSLAPFSDSPTTTQFALPITEGNYFELVDRSGKIVRHGKRGAIERDLPPILDRLAGGESCSWLDAFRHISRRYLRAIGNAASLESYRNYLGQKRLNGLRA
ncbi:MAG: transposase [Pseudomonadota bacterium]